MSDLFEAREKVEKGASWRGSINVNIDDTNQNLSVRQLRDPEQWEIMQQIDTDELDSLQDDLPEDKMDELHDLQEADTLSEDDEDRLEKLQTELEGEDINIFEKLSYETYNGLKQAAKYGTEPDEEDIRYALTNKTDDIEDTYGSVNRDNAKQYINDDVINPMIERSTNFASFAIGIKVLGETLGDTKN